MTMESTPALAAAYQTHSFAPPSGAAIDDSITTEPPLPPCFVDMRRTQAAQTRKAPPKVSTSSTSRMVAALGIVEPRIVADDAGAVHEMGERPERVASAIEHALDIVLDRHVALDGDRLAAGLLTASTTAAAAFALLL